LYAVRRGRRTSAHYLLDSHEAQNRRPLTYESHGPFRLLTASLPAAFTSGLVYVVLTLWFVVPSGRGGYRRA
jgi:hypothetical protein